MSERWKLNRIGLVNFWYFDDEEFYAKDGRLLLRGQNGSGKSICTQSFVPFIFDGDRTPGRLDPFGSSDRKMEYYFLIDGEKEESTGYLYMEFNKPETDRYLTLCIGQRARRGKPMGFWGFVLKDGRRIGRDFKLYRTSGNVKIPLEKNELKKVLGDSVPFTDEPRRYKELVNQNVFGYERMEQYDQFLNLLIKVRGSKLNSNFRPTQLYKILNDSLPVLSDDDLQPLVEAMEKMDDIQERLTRLRSSSENVTKIMNEYDRYNQFVLVKKHDTWMEISSRSEEKEKLYQKEVRETEKEKAELSAALQKLERLSAEKEQILKDKEQYLDPEMENMDLKLRNAETRKETLNAEIRRKEARIEEKNSLVAQCEREIRECDDRTAYQNRQINEKLKDMNDLNEELQLSVHPEVVSFVRADRSLSVEQIRTSISHTEKGIEKGRDSLADYDYAEKEYRSAKQMESEHFLLVQNRSDDLDKCEQRMDRVRDELIEEVHALSSNTYWKPEETAVMKVQEIIADYENPQDSVRFNEILREDFDHVMGEYNRRKLHNERLCEEQKANISAKEEEYNELLLQKDIEPMRDERTVQARRILKDAGIEAVPFYCAVTFAQGISEERQSQIEASLQRAGILDALVVSEQNRNRIIHEYPQLTDVILRVPDAHVDSHSTEELVCEDGLNEDLRNQVSHILNCFTDVFFMHENGSFTHGLLEGRADQDMPVYIGSAARMRKRTQMITALKNEIIILQEQYDILISEGKDIRNAIQGMIEEWDRRPDCGKLLALQDEYNEISHDLKSLYAAHRQMEKQTEQREVIRNERQKTMIENCRIYPYERTVSCYRNMLDLIHQYRDLFNSLTHIMRDMESEKTSRKHAEENREQALYDCDQFHLEKSRLTAEKEGIERNIEEFNHYLKSPETLEKAEKLKTLRERERMTDEKIRDTDRTVSILEHVLQGADERILSLKKDAEIMRHDRICAEKCLQEELDLRLVFNGSWTSLEEASAQIRGIDRSYFKDKTSADMVGKLFDVYNHNSSALSEFCPSFETVFSDPYEIMGDIPVERSRQRISASWNGKKLYLNAFAKILNECITDTELLIREKDRQIFENILSQTLSSKLTSRIDDSRRWVKAMSALMKNMKTSMGLHFALSWTPEEKEEGDDLSVSQLEKILNTDKELISAEDEMKAAEYFRNRISREKQRLEEIGASVNYMELVRDVLDYRKWFVFRMQYWRNNDARSELTNAAFNRFSGGEKAMAMYVPLFAAVNAQYQKANLDDHPRLIALDEAFAGVDDTNIAGMFGLVSDMDFDYIMNSQVLWGCHDTVTGLGINELLRPLSAKEVGVIRYTWDGRVRRME